MKDLRAILVGLIALSLTILPVGAAETRASMMAGLASTAAHTECCPKAEHCEKRADNGCDQSGPCALKCSVVPATTVAGMDVSLPALISPEPAPVIENLTSALEHPPLPPPRV